MAYNGGYGLSPRFWQNGPAPCALYNFPDGPTHSGADFAQRTSQPKASGASVLGVKFDVGVMLSADMLCSYGTMARYRDCPRIMKVNDNIVLACSGDYADFQYLKSIIEQRVIDDEIQDDGCTLKPTELYTWMTRLLYARRTKMNPLWVHLIVAGMEDGKPFLGSVDKLGSSYEDHVMATGFGSYIALPLLREATEPTPLIREVTEPRPPQPISEIAARKLLVESMRALYYRDALSYPKYLVGVVTAEGVQVDGPHLLESDWDIANTVE